MGKFSATVHIKVKTDKSKFKDSFCDVMKNRGFEPCSEDEAALSYLLAFSKGGWVTLSSDRYSDSPSQAHEDVRQIAEAMKTSGLSVEVIDSDFAIINLYGDNTDKVIVGDGSGYGIEDAPKGKRECWEPLLAEGKTWKQLSETWESNEVFAEGALLIIASILGIEGEYIDIDYDELYDKTASDDNIIVLHLKKAADTKGKSVSLNAAFVKVFGEALKPLGFKKIKSGYPYFVRVVPGGEIIHVITYRKEKSFNPQYEEYDVVGGIATVYRNNIDLSLSSKKQNWLKSNWWIYSQLHQNDLDKDFSDSFFKFSCSVNQPQRISDIEFAVNITKQIMLPVLETVHDIDSAIEFQNKMLLPMFLWDDGNFGNDNPNHDYDEGLLYFKTDNKNIFRERMKNAVDEITLREKNYFEKAQRDFDLFNSIQNELKRRKTENIKILKLYGLDF